ncbi:MAG: hypothetical protein SVK08_09760 [Halobacteriota archaeon]|nr:hypothetical protein [Halobacteriota archaeon]
MVTVAITSPTKKQITLGISELGDPINVSIGMTVREGNVKDQVHFDDTFARVKGRLREGFFCLVSNKDLTLKDALSIYRKKEQVEKIMNSLKNEIEIKPLRVWSEHSIYGALILVLLHK